MSTIERGRKRAAGATPMRAYWMRCCFGLLCLFALRLSGSVAVATTGEGLKGQGETERVPSIYDFLSLQQIKEVRPSPDGHLLAVEVSRPGEMGGSLSDIPGTDILLIDLRTSEVLRITDGAKDGSSYWAPLWAPNAMRLAFLTDRGQQRGAVRVAVWNLRSWRLAVLGTKSSVDTRVNWGGDGSGGSSKFGSWIDNDTLITVFLHTGENADSTRIAMSDEVPQTPVRDFGAKWTAAEKGRASVTVWNISGGNVCGGGDDLESIDVPRNLSRVLYRGSVRGVSVAPGGTYIAVITATAERGAVSRLSAGRIGNSRFLDVAVQTTLDIVRIPSGTVSRVFGAGNLVWGTVRWSPVWTTDGGRLAVPAFYGGGRDRVYYVSLATLKARTYSARSALDAQVLAQLVTSVRAVPPITALGKRFRFRVPEVATSSTGMYVDAPGRVIRLVHGRVGVLLHGALTIVGGEGERVTRVPAVGGRLIYPGNEDAVENSSRYVLTEDDSGVVRRIDGVASVPTVSIVGRLPVKSTVDAVLKNGDVIFSKTDKHGSSLSIERVGVLRRLLVLNAFLAGIKPPRQKLVWYSAYGRQLAALLWLPQDYDGKDRLPLIVVGYPAYYDFAKSGTEDSPLSDFWNYPAVLLATAGYAVLQPTIPRRPDDTVRRYDPITYFVTPVIAAVDAAVSQGYADAGRVGYYGHSAGGYLGLALETSTHVFKAIVVVAPVADLIEYHDSLGEMANLNSDCTPAAVIDSGALFFESKGWPFDMGGPPWREMGRYILNSPYFHLRNASTPLLMEEGEFDWGAPAVRNVYFELARKHTPAELAVYWGEGHVLATRGNILDGWRRTLLWFDKWIPGSRNRYPVQPHGAPRQ